MKFFSQQRILVIALGVSLLVHGALLAIHFVAPNAFRLKPSDASLEVILVNAKHDSKPLHADALAQANLDGGGNAEQGRAKSPLPDMRKLEDGQNAKASSRRVAELEARQQQILAQMQRQTALSVAQGKLAQPPQPSQVDGRELFDSAKAVARLEAEIAKNIEDYNKRPKKTQITPSTIQVGYAVYYKSLQDKIEKIGTLDFPQKDGVKLYGQLVLSIPVFQDGTIYQRDGGARVERSSGNAALDNAALAIVRRAAPFGRFPDNMRTSGKDDVWEIITRFTFSREQGLQTDLPGSRR
ncbi:TonB family protein [Herbaspirillum sp. RTI4]|uniref:TonB family protein n=1 Tax=Herbaspirillum sp. RTI4 TaxID=3048640 RepID=UPI002AB59ADC|nr:TonB family protein [Herbaspirillum sp. RTI4]MDY7577536.1 TonB family protein [Herbaspirillum sp. RTI4]MEA9981011.1 TonB family protein [Herbaspirillum sp. RTI4]